VGAGPDQDRMPAALSAATPSTASRPSARGAVREGRQGERILGRPVEFIYEDTGGDPATAVRKARSWSRRTAWKFLTGVVLSSEALAVSANARVKVIFMSTINGKRLGGEHDAGEELHAVLLDQLLAFRTAVAGSPPVSS